MQGYRFTKKNLELPSSVVDRHTLCPTKHFFFKTKFYEKNPVLNYKYSAAFSQENFGKIKGSGTEDNYMLSCRKALMGPWVLPLILMQRHWHKPGSFCIRGIALDPMWLLIS